MLGSQKKTISTIINLVKRQTLNEKHQILQWYVGQYKPKTSFLSFEAVKGVLLTPEKPMIEIDNLRE